MSQNETITEDITGAVCIGNIAVLFTATRTILIGSPENLEAYRIKHEARIEIDKVERDQ